jgi:hypothetical protein
MSRFRLDITIVTVDWQRTRQSCLARMDLAVAVLAEKNAFLQLVDQR